MWKNKPLGDIVIELTEIDSTNNYAMRLLNAGMAEHGLVVRADFQTQGKGQHGNTWQAEESKNLLVSVLVDTTSLSLDKQFYLNAFICVCLAEYLMLQIGMKDIQIKWPNDIYAGKKKIAGILIENNIRGNVWANAIVGIGLNINQTVFPDLNRATSVQIEMGKKLKVTIVLKQLLKHLNKHISAFYNNPESLLATYNTMLMGNGKPLSYIKNHEMMNGNLLGVDSQGLLMVELRGKVKKYKHKEIEWVL